MEQASSFDQTSHHRWSATSLWACDQHVVADPVIEVPISLHPGILQPLALELKPASVVIGDHGRPRFLILRDPWPDRNLEHSRGGCATGNVDRPRLNIAPYSWMCLRRSRGGRCRTALVKCLQTVRSTPYRVCYATADPTGHGIKTGNGDAASFLSACPGFSDFRRPSPPDETCAPGIAHLPSVSPSRRAVRSASALCTRTRSSSSALSGWSMGSKGSVQ